MENDDGDHRSLVIPQVVIYEEKNLLSQLEEKDQALKVANNSIADLEARLKVAETSLGASVKDTAFLSHELATTKEAFRLFRESGLEPDSFLFFFLVDSYFFSFSGWTAQVEGGGCVWRSAHDNWQQHYGG